MLGGVSIIHSIPIHYDCNTGQLMSATLGLDIPTAELANTRKKASLLQRFCRVRQQSLALARPLTEADAQLQSMPDVSPCKWHLAHTTWFFETFILFKYQPNYQPYNPLFNYLFNSYYNGIGEQYPRHQRGLISRPSLQEVIDYRLAIDECIQELLHCNSLELINNSLELINNSLELVNSSLERINSDSELTNNDIELTNNNFQLISLIELGLQHEQQHQELMLTDIKHAFFSKSQFPSVSNKLITSIYTNFHGLVVFFCSANKHWL